MNNPHDFQIRHKHDLDNAHKLIELGYPAVAPLLPHLLEWIQDMNWPVAKTIAPFLVSIGEPLVPEVKEVFATDDYGWQYICITDIIKKMPAELSVQFRPELERLAYHATKAEKDEDLDKVALQVLTGR